MAELKDIKKGDPILASQLQMLVDSARKSNVALGQFNSQTGNMSRNILPPTFPALNYGSNEQLSQLFLAKVLEDPEEEDEVWIGSNGGIMCRIYFLHDNVFAPNCQPVIVDEDWWLHPPGDGSTQADYAEVAWTKKGAGTFAAGTLTPALEVGDIITVSGTEGVGASVELNSGDGAKRVWEGHLNKQPMPYSVYFFAHVPDEWLVDDPNRHLAQMGASTIWAIGPKDDTNAVESWRGLLWGNVRLEDSVQEPPPGAIPGLNWGDSWVDYRGDPEVGYAYSVAWQNAPPDKSSLIAIYRAVEDYKFTWVEIADTAPNPYPITVEGDDIWTEETAGTPDFVVEHIGPNHDTEGYYFQLTGDLGFGGAYEDGVQKEVDTMCGLRWDIKGHLFSWNFTGFNEDWQNWPDDATGY